ATHAAPEQNAHPNVLTAFEANALERQTNLHGVAGVGEPAGTVPDPVGRGVLTAGNAVQHVHLNAARVHHHVVRELTRAERVETETNPVVVPRIVAARD